MQPKQLAVVISAVALLSAGLGVVATSAMRPKEVKVSFDLGGGNTLDLSKLVGDVDDIDRARLNANESVAISTLRSIASAQRQVQSAVVIDMDQDGAGEYAYFGEMAGATPVRGAGDPIDPAILTSAFGKVSPDGIVERFGYLFQIYLPGATVGERTPGIAEGSETKPDADAAEVLWCVYAWPVEAGVTGERAFFINHEGDLTATPNADYTYNGEDAGPAFDAALGSEHPRDMGSLVPLAVLDQTSNDGRAWSSVGR